MEVSTVERWLEVNLAYSADDDDENEGDFWTNDERDLTTFQNDNFRCYKLFGFILSDNTLPVNRDCLFICVFQDWLLYHNITGCLNNLISLQVYESSKNLVVYLLSSEILNFPSIYLTLCKLNKFIILILHWFKWMQLMVMWYLPQPLEFRTHCIGNELIN